MPKPTKSFSLIPSVENGCLVYIKIESKGLETHLALSFLTREDRDAFLTAVKSKKVRVVG